MVTQSQAGRNRRRDDLRAQGLRQVRIWVMDTNAPGFAEEARRQSLANRASPDGAEIMAWLESVSAWPEDQPK
ncbi:MAG: antitoxin MazE family protein [Alphaproteobacteria bacterium]|nr:antitoxin MazE family protein [Alphaproteobacteria bacterium]